MKVIHLISGGDSGGAKTHVLSLLQNLNKTITAQLVCFRDGPFADEARKLGIPTRICGGNNVLRVRRELTIAAVGANPWSAYGWHFEPDKFVRALREVIDLPVVNVKED